MDTPAALNWAADRNVVFKRTIALPNYDFTGGSFRMQVRDRRDGGATRADLSTVTSGSAEGVRLIYAGTATVAAHIAAARLTQAQADQLGLASGTSLLLSQLGIRINETTMQAMPLGTEVGDDKVLVHDLLLTPSGGDEDVYARGDFTVRAGVTAP
jgi:hypothetical protein